MSANQFPTQFPIYMKREVSGGMAIEYAKITRTNIEFVKTYPATGEFIHRKINALSVSDPYAWKGDFYRNQAKEITAEEFNGYRSTFYE